MFQRLTANPRDVARRPFGSHLCHFYREPEDLLELIPPFFADGIEDGQRCIWALPSWLKFGRAAELLARAGPRLEYALADGTMRLVQQEEAYGDGRGGFRGVEPALEHWLAEEKASLKRGFTGLRVSGDCSPRLGKDWGEFQRYEKTVDLSIGETKIAGLCTYDLREASREQVEQIMLGHQLGVVRRAHGWEEFSGGLPSFARAAAERLV